VRSVVRTPGNWLACPNGHGKLIPEQQEESCGSWFEDDTS
jgi:hypothetical protein